MDLRAGSREDEELAELRAHSVAPGRARTRKAGRLGRARAGITVATVDARASPEKAHTPSDVPPDARELCESVSRAVSSAGSGGHA